MGESYLSYREESGSVNISEDVVASIVRSAVTEVEGVSGVSTTAGAELAELIGMSDRILIMKDGQFTKEFPRNPDLKEHDIINYMI